MKSSITLSQRFEWFHKAIDPRAYEYMGARPEKHFGKAGFMFRCWAPEAKSVSVVGDFNNWEREKSPMSRQGGIWELFIPGLSEFDAYKFSIENRRGSIINKADPYAFHAELRPGTASKLYSLSGYEWGDAGWMKFRRENEIYGRPLNIYEVHLGSWRTNGDSSPFNYEKMAEELIPYVKELGYTHIELMPVTEHPLDASWGYQCTGYFAVTSRFGTPKQFMSFVDRCHQAGVGVILDWVPAHFPKDEHGLVEFDGSYCYEYADPLKMEHKDWGTRVFDYGKPEVRSFLASSAMFWLEIFHIDGIRVDAVASMLYLDYSRKQWRPNRYGGKENLEALEFIRKLNEHVFDSFPDVLMIAEESTAWPMVTKPTYMGGLGFNLKWNMGWMNDMCHYLKLDPILRQYNHKDITFSLMYAFSENYVLPISHDEVVHGKGSLINKMPGFPDDKFAGLRSFLAYMMFHPGKKMMFMGAEFGQFREWNFESALDWELLEDEKHQMLLRFVRALNMFYLERPELWEVDCDWSGFAWICHDDYGGNTIAFSRFDKKGGELVFICNFSPVFRQGYFLGVNEDGIYDEVFNSDRTEYGGWGNVNNPDGIPAVEPGWHNKRFAVYVDIPPFGAVVLKKRPGTGAEKEPDASLKELVVPKRAPLEKDAEKPRAKKAEKAKPAKEKASKAEKAKPAEKKKAAAVKKAPKEAKK